MPIIRPAVAIIAALSLGLLGCTDREKDARLTTLEKANAELSERCAKQEAAIVDLRKQADQLNSAFTQDSLSKDNLILAALKPTDRLAVLDPSDPGFDKAFNKGWLFVVSVKNVEQYLDGSKVTLSIGNPWNAGFSNTTLNITYGRKRGSNEDFGAWQKSLYKVEHPTLFDIRAGRWTNCEVALPHFAPEYLNYLSVGVDAPNIYLLAPPN